MLKTIEIPSRYNYIAVFLTLVCNLRCSYCINRFGELSGQDRLLTGAQWVEGLSRISSRPDLPITLGGGEPSLHPDFTSIIIALPRELEIDLLTNLQFDIATFMAAVPPDRLRRTAPYASIRVSYHPETMDLDHLVEQVLTMQRAGYSIGIWGVLHPQQETEILRAQEFCRAAGIDFRTKEFLGEYKGRMYGSIRYPGACDRGTGSRVSCRTSELIIGPGGDVYRCHADLYEGRRPTGHILDPDFEIDELFRECDYFGYCNPCDVKLKTDRFQVFGHTSVEIHQN